MKGTLGFRMVYHLSRLVNASLMSYGSKHIINLKKGKHNFPFVGNEGNTIFPFFLRRENTVNQIEGAQIFPSSQEGRYGTSFD